MPIAKTYIWFLWSLTFLVPWLALYWRFPTLRQAMWQSSLMTAPLGLTEPIFVPAYWSPPSLFNLAERTGFDVESIIFSFGIGGIASASFNLLFHRGNQVIDARERLSHLHRHHYLALSVPFVLFPFLYFLPINPIYTSSMAMLFGAFTNVLCRPDLKKATFVGGAFFVAYYAVFIIGLAVAFPAYIENVWNMPQLTGVMFSGVPIEEFFFAATFGMYWSGFYHHVYWLRHEPLHNRSCKKVMD